MEAAGNLGEAKKTQEAIRRLLARETFGECFVIGVLRRELGL
jgi:hypothetical protein